MRLRTDRAEVVVDLERGGRLASLVVDGLSLLVSESRDPLGWGCYVMAPFAGRVRDGRFRFGGREHELRRNGGAHALHGTVFDVAWEQTGEATLVADLGDGWPWSGEVEQTLELTDDGLRMDLTVRSFDAPMPVSCGWHPWWRRRLDRGGPLILDARPLQAYEVDDELIPTGEIEEVPTPPWDTPFTGMEVPPRLIWPGALEVVVRSSARRWVLYTEPEHALCVEPQTARPDALGTDEADVVEPGTPLSAWMQLSWTALHGA